MVGKIRFLVLFCLCALPRFSYAYCMENWACITKVESATGVEFWASNIKDYTITATLEVDAGNLQHNGKVASEFTNTMVLAGNEKRLILKLDRINSKKRHWYSDSFYWTPGNMNAVHENPDYLLPYALDERYRIVQGFGGGYSHRGASRYAVDIAMPVGTAVHAARGGTVIDVVEKHNRGGASRRYAKYANFITIQHSDGTTGEYYHLRKNGSVVDVGDQISTGQHIGYSGNTGFSSLPHLHFAIYRAKSHGNYESLPFKFAKR